jgi:DNA invertase Pin-like site-specific DNA recombinase
MNKITALYCRTLGHEPDEMARQRTALQHYSDVQCFGEQVLYEDDGYSALDPARPAFLRLEQDIRDGKVARVLATSLTRLGRNTAEGVRWAVWLRRHGVELVTLEDAADLNPLLAGLEGGTADE